MFYNWFPLGLALGDAFCDRQKERQQFADNFKMIRHSLLISPRRYGKTSLVMQSIQENGCIAVKIDFFSVTNVEVAQQRILDGIGNLIPQMMTKAEFALKVAKDFFKNFHLSVQYKNVGFSIGIKPAEADISQTIVSALRALEQIAEKTKNKVVLFFDELQAISYLEKNSLVIEGALREVAQEAKHTAYVFSGSNRHLLSQLFDDRSRPLYLLCQRMNIERIGKEAYQLHFQKAAKDVWGKTLDFSVINAILEVTEHHPYYVNALCSRLWASKIIPIAESVYESWNAYTLEERARIATELDFLSNNQRKLLIAIARANHTKKLTSQVFLNEIGLSSASVLQSLSALVKKDYLEKQKNGSYRLIDPLMRMLLQQPY